MLHDAELENLIDQAGRAEVFSKARAIGCTAGCPVPKYVWQEIATKIINDRERRIA